MTHPNLWPADIDAPSELKVMDVTADSSVLTWVPPLADIDGYILTYSHEHSNAKVLSSETHLRAYSIQHKTITYIGYYKFGSFYTRLHCP